MMRRMGTALKVGRPSSRSLYSWYFYMHIGASMGLGLEDQLLGWAGEHLPVDSVTWLAILWPVAVCEAPEPFAWLWRMQRPTAAARNIVVMRPKIEEANDGIMFFHLLHSQESASREPSSEVDRSCLSGSARRMRTLSKRRGSPIDNTSQFQQRGTAVSDSCTYWQLLSTIRMRSPRIASQAFSNPNYSPYCLRIWL